MTGAGSVLALVLTEWTMGWVGAAAWTQSWGVVRRGHFRITAWIVLVIAGLAYFAVDAAVPSGHSSRTLALFTVGLCALYLLAQYVRSERAGAVVGAVAMLAGGATLVSMSALIDEWPRLLAALELLAGAVLLGAVTNGMMLGHWYLNQPGLKHWALASLTQLSVGGVAATALLGVIAVGLLTSASTEGAVLGLSGFGDEFGWAFYAIWLVLLGFTGVVVWAARRCVKIRSIQSATGLYYVAILTAGVDEFLVRYLMVNAS
jgi:hypothetical protein